MQEITEAQVKELLELSKEASKGPWEVNQMDDCFIEPRICMIPANGCYDYSKIENNAQFITQSRNLLPALAESWLEMAGEAEGLRRTETTNIKFITEVIYEVQDEDISPDERLSSYQIYECCKCHWRFTGEAHRFGYGYTCQGVDTPNYCPMCGTKIGDIEEDSAEGGPA